MIEILGYWSVKHGEICSWLSVPGIFQFAFVCFWLTSYPSYSIHTLWSSLTHIVWSFDLMAWNKTSRQQYSCVVWLFWRSYQHGTLVYLHQALKKIFQVTNWWNDSGLLQWTQSWTRKPPTARLSSAIFFDGWPKTALPSLDNVSKILQRSIHTKLDRL